jgi:outer membrane putative beta-barrel porin/alpha-amylase
MADVKARGACRKCLALFPGALALVLWPAVAAAQAASTQTSDDTGLDFFRPPPNLFQLQYEYRTAPGSTRDVTTDTLNLRYDHAFYLTPTLTVVTRSDLPLLARNTINASNPNGDYVYGIGDADIQAAVIQNLDKRWAVGFGARLIAPTGADPLGSGKWQVMPIVGFRVALPEISSSSYFEPIFRYDQSVAGDPTRRTISNLQFGPALNVGLPDRWFVTFYPSQDIRINYGDPITGQTGRLFLPFDARVSKKLSDNVTASLEVGVPIIRDYPVYNFKGQFRLNVSW